MVEDFARVSGLLRTFAPVTGEQPDLPPGDRRHVGQAIAAAAKITSDIGRWNQTTVRRMGSAHEIYVPAQTLTGTQVTGVEALAEAKLMGRCVPADAHLVEVAGALYARTAQKKDPALRGASGLTLRVDPLRPDAVATAPSHDPIERSR